MNSILSTHIQNQILTRPNKLNDDLIYNGKPFNHRTNYDNIKEYVDDFISGNTTNRLLLLSGLRGVGKSTILLQIYEYLLKEKHINQNNILYISGDNLKQMTNSTIMDGVTSYLEIFHNTTLDGLSDETFLLIDEAQFDENWDLTAKVIYDSTKRIFMIISGSSALKLSYNADAARRLINIPITPLNYPEHLKLKYNNFKNNITENIIELIFDGKTDKINQIETDILKAYPDLKGYSVNEWDEFLKHGGFPTSFYQKEKDIIKGLVDTTRRVITEDIKNIKGINGATQDLAFRLMYFLALQNPGEVSLGSMANTLDSNKPTITKLLDSFEKTQLIFHIPPFTSSAKRTTKPNKYYFATSSLKHALSTNLGNAVLEDKNAYMGKLLENFVASSFFNLENRSDVIYKAYYDNAKRGKKGVDFVIQRGLEKPIPIEVSYGNKDKTQIIQALSRYKSDYGIIISNSTPKIAVKDNIIYLPAKIFAFL